MNALAIKLVAVIAVVAVVGGGAAIMLTGDNSNSDRDYKIDGMLPVFGNANEDYAINDKDREIVQKIINNEEGYSIETYPFADANYDEKITKEDLDVINNIIASQKTDVYIINTYFDNTTYVDVVHWPCTAMASAGVSTLPMLYKCAGVLDYVKGMALSDPWNADPVLYSQLADFKSLGPNMREFDVDKVKSLMDSDKIDCIVCIASLKDNEAIFKGMGLSIIRPNASAANVEDFTSAMLLMGFIFNTNTQALMISEWFQELKEEIDTGIANKTKTKAILVDSSGNVSASNASYSEVLLTAGAVFPAKIAGTTTSTKYGDWIYSELTDCDVAIDIHSGSSSNSWFLKNCDVSEYSQTMLKYKDTTMYENERVYVIAFDLPIPLKVTFAATALYPEVFSESWATEKAQDFFDKFFGGNITASELNVFLTTEEITSLAKS